MEIRFHEQAAARFNEMAQELLTKAVRLEPVPTRPEGASALYPVVRIGEQDINGKLKWNGRSINGYGDETGRHWDTSSGRMGYEGDVYLAVKELASRLAKAAPIKGKVSEEFLLREVIVWIEETLSSKRSDRLIDFLTEKLSKAIAVQELWIPVYRTYSSQEIALGDLTFKPILPAMLDRWYSRIPLAECNQHPEATLALSRQRSTLQGTLAVCVTVEADPIHAADLAHVAADEAVAMLRFLSEANWTCRITSHCLPMGKENTRTAMAIRVEGGEIRSIRRSVLEQGPVGWNVDEARKEPLNVGVLELLQSLVTRRDESDFYGDVYAALQLHARASITSDISHKLVFVVAAAESIFLRNASEPIQKNLGERMAFLVGHDVDERRKVIKNVDEFYGIRSALIHHGKDVQDHQKDVVDEFFVNVWFSFVVLMRNASAWKSRNQMFIDLEERKLS